MAPPADRQLVAAARAGDRDAFGTVVDRHHAALLRTCRRALGDPAGAAEVAQEAVLHALTGLPFLRDDDAFGPWLWGKEDGGPRRLPIWIGRPEATTLAARLHAVDLPRPDTYRFAADLLAAAGVRLREVRVVRLADAVFYAQAVLEDGTSVDARPSDAIRHAADSVVAISVT